jgi:hypothetical protein
MKTSRRRVFWRLDGRVARPFLKAILSLGVVTGLLSAPCTASSATKKIEARVEAVQKKLDRLRVQPITTVEQPRLAQWYNWNNWPNSWSNWQNQWGNY